MQYRKEVALEFPNLTLGEVSKKCGEKWSSLNEEDKNTWKEKALQLKNENVQPDSTTEKKKRKPSSYLMFSMQHRKDIIDKEPGLSLGEVSKRCGQAWKELSDI